MKTLAYCWTCGKEHDITNKGLDERGYKCDCGGYIITPSGKINMKLVPENIYDQKMLGIKMYFSEQDEIVEEKRPLPKIFRIDEYSWVCAMNLKMAVEWYSKTSGISEDDLFLDVYECDIDTEKMYTEISENEIIEKIKNIKDNNELSLDISNKNGSLFIHETFRDAIEDLISHLGYEKVTEEPFEICTTEE